MNQYTINTIINLARAEHNARRNQGQRRLMNIGLHLEFLKERLRRQHVAPAQVNKVFNMAFRHIQKMNKNYRVNQRVQNAVHRFKMGPRLKAARPTLNYLPPNVVKKISELVRKRKREN